MGIRTITIVVITSAFLVAIFALYMVSNTILMDGFLKIEQDSVAQNVDRVNDALDNKLNELSIKLSDWAQWDDTYHFVQNRNQAFIESNLQNEALGILQINYIIFIDKNSHVVYAKGIDLETRKEASPGANILSMLLSEKILMHNKTGESSTEGIVTLPQGNLLISSRPILKTSGQGPIQGTVIFGRYLDAPLIKLLADLTHLDLTIYSLHDPKLSLDLRTIQSKFSSQTSEPLVQIENEETVKGYQVVYDINQNPALLAEITSPRTIIQQGKNTFRAFSILLVSTTGLTSILILLFLERNVLSRIASLTKGVRTVSSDDSLTTHVELVGRDELSHLAEQINSLIDASRASKDKIIHLLQEARSLDEQLQKEKEGVEKKVEERTLELGEEHARLQASINSLNIGFIMTDTKKSTILINNTARRLLLRSSHQQNSLIEQNLSVLNQDTSLVNLEKELGGTVPLQKYIDACLKEMKPGKLNNVQIGGRYLNLYFNPIAMVKDTLQVIGTVVLIEDMTQAIILERSKDEFFSIASHELRTPLTSIRGNISLIQEYYGDQFHDENLKEMIADIHESSVRLIAIVNDFLNVSRLEQGRMTFKNEAFDIVDLAQNVIKELEAMSNEKHITLQMIEPQFIFSPAFGDKFKVKEILINLVGNAIKFTDQGGVTISFEPQGETILVRVKDTGKGISSYYQNYLFKKFQQAGDNILTRDTTKGTGLGLYISKLMIEGMGGKIYLESSRENEGSTFVFVVPIAKIVAAPQSQELPPQTPQNNS